jgi:hypothetical protein
MQKVDDVLEKEPGDAIPTNPEDASRAIESLTFTDKPPTDAPEALLATAPVKQKRRTKAELEADVARLTADIERRNAEATANAPDLIAAMKHPLSLSFMSLFNVLATWRGDHWKKTKTEMDMLAEAWAPVAGPLLAKHPQTVLWASAIGVTYSVAYPSLQVEQQMRAAALAATDTTGKEPTT